MFGGIAARRLTPAGVDSTEIFLREAKIHYLVIGRARISAVIDDARWAKSLRLEPERVYARTADGIFLTRLRSLSKAERELSAQGDWLRVHQSILVNAARIEWLELAGTKRKLVGFELRDGTPRRRRGRDRSVVPTHSPSTPVPFWVHAKSKDQDDQEAQVEKSNQRLGTR